VVGMLLVGPEFARCVRVTDIIRLVRARKPTVLSTGANGHRSKKRGTGKSACSARDDSTWPARDRRAPHGLAVAIAARLCRDQTSIGSLAISSARDAWHRFPDAGAVGGEPTVRPAVEHGYGGTIFMR
jgi:hypothetical protein